MSNETGFEKSLQSLSRSEESCSEQVQNLNFKTIGVHSNFCSLIQIDLWCQKGRMLWPVRCQRSWKNDNFQNDDRFGFDLWF